MAGIGFALLWSLITRPFGGEIAAWRLVHAGWSDLAELAAGRRIQDHERLAGRMLDRLGQIVPRLVGMDDKELAKVDGYAEIRLGLNIVELQRLKRRLTPDEVAAVSTALAGVADLYGERIERHSAVEPPRQLLHEIDAALVLASGRQTVPARRAVDALVGMRRALFPNSVSPSFNRDLPAIEPALAAE